MHPLGRGGNVREAHFSPAGVDRSTPSNEKGKGAIVKHVSLRCQNTARGHNDSILRLRCFRKGGGAGWKFHPVIYGS